MSDIEAMKQAHEFLRDNQHHIADNERHTYVMEYNAFIEKLEQAIAEAEKQEPVAWWNGKYASPVFAFKRDTPGIGLGNPDAVPLYTHSQTEADHTWFKKCCELQDELKALQEQEGHGLTIAYMSGFQDGKRERNPLTDEQLEKGRDQTFSINNPFCPCDSKTFRKVARWVEAAHNIKEKT